MKVLNSIYRPEIPINIRVITDVLIWHVPPLQEVLVSLILQDNQIRSVTQVCYLNGTSKIKIFRLQLHFMIILGQHKMLMT